MSNLDVFEVKWLLAVLAVQCSLRALSLVVALLFVEANSFFAGGAGDDHELTLPLVVQLWKKKNLSHRGNLCGVLEHFTVFTHSQQG